MTAKEYLNQAYWLDRRIDSKLEQLSALKDMATKTPSPDAVSTILANPSPDSSSEMPEIVVQILDLTAKGNRYMSVLFPFPVFTCFALFTSQISFHHHFHC